MNLAPWLALSLLYAGGAAFAAGTDDPDVERLPAVEAMPDPLVVRDGTRVRDSADWQARRRPELKAMFEHYMYGVAPPAPAKVSGEVVREDREFLGGKAVLREVALSFGPAGTPKIHLLLIEPAGAGPFPVFVGPNFYGNHTAVNDPKVALPEGWVPDRSASPKDHRATEAGRGFQADAWAADAAVARGYALATFYSGDVAPDHPGHADGVHPHYPEYDWGTVRAWAWGLSRVADYLATDPTIDPARMAVVGHSRMGKAALVAGAFDERFRVVISHQAGCGGSAPSRGKVGESVARINTSFPHWFNASFKTFNDRTERLPFDQNALAALVAPRALLFTNATEDTWANPAGQFEVLAAAESVYRLFPGVGGLASPEAPEVGKLSAGRLGYAIRPGKHSMTREDWAFFLAYADAHLGR